MSIPYFDLAWTARRQSHRQVLGIQACILNSGTQRCQKIDSYAFHAQFI